MYFVRPAFLVLLLFILVANVALTFILPHQIAYAELMPTAGSVLSVAGICICLHLISQSCRDQWPRFACLVRSCAAVAEGVILVVLMAVGLRIMDYLTKGTALPLADDWLARIGPALGFDWLAYFDFVRARPGLQWVLSTVYISLEMVCGIFILALVVSGHHAKVRLFAEAAILCAVISLIGGTLFPAIGAAAYWVPDYADPASYDGFAYMPGVYFVDTILALRQLDTSMMIGKEPLTGLVSVPSLHTALGVLLIAVARRTWLFWPALAYGTVMIAATPIWGGHYLFDLIAGAAVALAVTTLLQRGAVAAREGRAPDAPAAA